MREVSVQIISLEFHLKERSIHLRVKQEQLLVMF
jgi:hypothetical protein